jgi:hypothetical protein
MKKALLVGLLFFFPVVLHAETSFGSWSLGTTADGAGQYAAVTNNAGSLLGKYCYPGGCAWMIAGKAKCEENVKHPVLINTDIGSDTMEMICAGSFTIEGNVYYRTVFSNFESINSTVGAANRIGFATPHADGTFIVARFDLNGASAALSALTERQTEWSTQGRYPSKYEDRRDEKRL